jgi:hypothetical protein
MWKVAHDLLTTGQTQHAFHPRIADHRSLICVRCRSENASLTADTLWGVALPVADDNFNQHKNTKAIYLISPWPGER